MVSGFGVAEEVINIGSIIEGKVYAVLWREHKHKRKTEQFEYLRVLSVNDSGKSFLTCAGGRTFSKLKWFGPLP